MFEKREHVAFQSFLTPKQIPCHTSSRCNLATDFKIDNDGNLVRLNGDLVLVSGKGEIAQRLQSRFRTMYRGWRYNRRLGFPTIGKGGMFDSSTPLVTRLAMCRKYISDTDGVLEVSKFDAVVDPVGKGIAIALTLQTNEGEIEMEINL